MAKDKYTTHVKPFLSEIKEMKSHGATERQIANELHISYASFNNYKEKHKELQEVLLDANEKLVSDVRGVLYKRAVGYYVTETKHTEIINPDGTIAEKTETNNKYIAPDVGAAVLLLKNYDDTFSNDDKETRDRKERELQVKEKNLENNMW